MSHHSKQPAPKTPRLGAHLGALVMPFTMVVLIPYWLVTPYTSVVSPWALRLSGVMFFAASLLLFASTLWLFVQVGNGTLAPWDPTKRLVVAGPYRYCRNPMISGVLGMILGEAAFFGSLALLGWGVIFFIVNTLYFVAFEEPDLQHKFGQSYADYKRRVPRWLPLGRLRT